MATRVNRKTVAAATATAVATPKETINTEKISVKNEPATEAPSKPSTASKSPTKPTSIGKRVAKAKKIIKKTIGIKLKAKAKKQLKVNALPLLQAAKTVDSRKKLLRNGVKEIKPKKRRKQIKKEPTDDSPPVLEPIFPIEENVENKKQPKKRTTKKALKTTTGELVEVTKIKLETEEDLSLSSDITDISTNELPTLSKQAKKPRAPRKPKVQSETLEDVMNDLSFLIKSEDIKKEVDSMSESGRSDTTTKPKKLTKRQRIELLKKKMIKKENIENTLSKLDSADEKVIDMLDLNVRRVKKKKHPVAKRRHSIEKFPISTLESVGEAPLVFNHVPRGVSPKSKRASKGRQSVEGMLRPNPYSTRSDSPARMLRNGKQRQLKGTELLTGLESIARKRRRLCSDLSDLSKLSGYESDSSFSDMSSLHGADANDVKEMDGVKSQPSASADTAPSTAPTDNLGVIDTNSNLCSKPAINSVSGDDVMLPDKAALLDIMKQAFNDVSCKKTSPKASSKAVELATTKFYGRSSSRTRATAGKVETVVTETPSSLPLSSEDVSVEAATFQEVEAVEQPQPLEAERDRSENESAITDSAQQPACPDQAQLELLNQPNSCLNQPGDQPLSNLDPPPEDIEVEGAANCSKTSDQFDLFASQSSCEDMDRLVLSEAPDELIPEPGETVYEAPTDLTQPTEVRNDGVQDGCENLSTQLEEAEEKEPAESVEVSLTKSGDNSWEEDFVDVVGEDLPLKCDNVTMTDDNTVTETSIENVEESAEDLAAKESVLKALGLQSLREAEEAKQKTKEKPSGSKSDNYTGTLKTVIKLNRDKKKGGRNTIKMTLQRNKIKNVSVEEEPNVAEDSYRISKEVPSSVGKQTTHSSDTAGAQRKSHYSNRSNMDGSSEHTSDGEAAAQDGAVKTLVIPEKASSFSIHPGRLCKDECSYCFGKFGLFDTPCHIAQMKSVDRQNKILATEKHLTRDSCLCDACYRHIDRKSNTPSYVNRSLKRNSLVAPGPRQNHCHVLGCSKESTNILRRKWIIKMRKSICQVINIDLDNPGLHSIPICDEHYLALEHLMVCAMCKRRLARNHIHYLGPETIDLNTALNAEGIPLTLTDKPVVCKLCKCFASIILKAAEERLESSENFFREYKKRLLHFNDIVPMDEAAAEEPIAVPSKTERLDHIKKKKKLVKNPLAVATTSEGDCHEFGETPDKIQDRVPSTDDTNSQPQSRSGSPSDDYNGVDYNTLIPAIAMDCGSDSESKKEPSVQQPVVMRKMMSNVESLKDAVEITKIHKTDKTKNSDIAVQKLGANPSISVRQLFPGEEDLPLAGSVDFNNIKERTPEGWEKCSSIIQYDSETKRLWQELQKPYGNQSSFLRHLVLLEKYFRNGDLVLSARASHHSINYSESVHNRLRAYDNIPSSAGNIQPLSMLPFNKMKKSSSGIITSANVSLALSSSTNHSSSSSSTSSSNSKPLGNLAMSITTLPNNTNNSPPKNTPLTISQLNSPPLLPASSLLQPIRPKLVGAPPGLISLHPGTARPVAPLVKVPQPQKIKFPITKNWRPNLIPIDPTKKQEKRVGLVQVISGGKPYHITLEDYKKMCAIKRSFEIKQKRLQEAQSAKPILVTHNSVLKSIIPRKGLIISKTATVKNETTTPPPPPPPALPNGEGETILEQLDKHVEKLEAKLNEKPTTSSSSSSSSLLLPRIPKSLTVIPQTVTRRTSRPASPVSVITTKSGSVSKS